MALLLGQSLLLDKSVFIWIKLRQAFLKRRSFLWLRHIDDIFFIWTHGEPELKKFINLINLLSNLKFTYKSLKKELHF